MKYRRFLLIFISLLFIQTSFLYFSFGTFLPNNLFGSLLFNLALTALLFIIDTLFKKVGKWVVFALVLFFAAYAIAQINFKEFMGNYISFVQAKDGATRIGEYVIQFIQFIKLRYYLILLAPLMTLIPTNENHHLKKINLIISVTILIISAIISNLLIPSDNNIEKYLASNGPITYLFNDIYKLIFGQTSDNNLIFEVSPSPETSPETDNSRSIDQSEWESLADKEEDENIVAIDNFLMNQNITDYNEYTGIFKDKNVITIMIEAFDYMAIDEILTPTLYKMQTQGWFFENYYTPKYSCTTGESEFIGLVSLVPENDTCAPNDYSTNLYPYSLFNLFKNEGYHTYAFHNWYDEFYERRTTYGNMGVDEYYNKEDLNITEYKGWPSDIELMEQAYDLINKDENFYAHIVTSSTHFPYDQDSWSADLHLEEINEIYPDYPMEVKRYLSKAMVLDDALNYLITSLEEDNLLDDTVILIYADHHPLKTSYETIETYSHMDRTSYTYSIDHSPMIIYGGGIEANTYSDIMSTFDIVPTLANLCGIEFDPRFYIGNDYFAPNKETMVIFANGDFLVKEGYYSNIEEVFYSFDGETISSERLEYLKILATNKITVSSLILQNDYFRYRNFID